MSLTLQIVSIYHHIGRRQITLFSALFQIPSHSLKSSRASLFFHSRENRSVPKFSFIVIYFIARSSRDSILATDKAIIWNALTIPSCLASYHFRAIIVRDGRIVIVISRFFFERLLFLIFWFHRRKYPYLEIFIGSGHEGWARKCEWKV